MKNNKKLFVYNIGSKYNLSVMDIVNKVLKLMNKKIKPIILNNSKIEIKKQKLNYLKASKELNWKPNAQLDKSLKKTIIWYKDNLSYFNNK